MSFARRLLLYVLAAVPAVWGNCPYWFAGGGCGPAASTARAQAGTRTRPACPCCRHTDNASPRDGPAAPPPDCDDCPMTVARRGSMPVPPSVELPARELGAGTVVPDLPLAPPAGDVAASPWVRPPGAPPDPRLLSTVVLTI